MTLHHYLFIDICGLMHIYDGLCVWLIQVTAVTTVGYTHRLAVLKKPDTNNSITYSSNSDT